MDYTSLANVKAYNPVDGTTDDTLIASLITGYSAQVDAESHITFGPVTYVNEILRPRIDIDGLLSITVPSPTVNTVTALAYRLPGGVSYASVDLTTLEIDSANFGTQIRVLGQDYSNYRGSNIRVQFSGQGGWPNLAAVPADFELAVRRLVWWGYKKRENPTDDKSITPLGMVIHSSQWPADVKQALGHYARNWV